MAGFPTRINRESLGPALEDERPVRDPRREIGAQAFGLAWWQTAGLSRVSPQAVLTATLGIPLR